MKTKYYIFGIFQIYFFFRNNPFAIIIPKEAIKKERTKFFFRFFIKDLK
jgi:hypothetical protein